MKLLNVDFKKGYVKVKVENMGDLWHLSHIVAPGDFVKGRTFRKVKIDSSERGKAAVKKPVVLKIKIEKVEFHKTSDILRLSGVVVEGPEDVPRGSHHTINVEDGVVFSLEKAGGFLGFQIKHFKEASKDKGLGILVCVFDRGEAMFALLKKYGYDVVGEISGEVAKKYVKEKMDDRFYKDLSKAIEDYVKKYSIDKLVVGSPAFWKDELYKVLKDDIKEITVLTSCNSVGKNGVNEVLKRPEIKKVLKEERVGEEVNAVEDLLKEISKEGNAVYGFHDSKNAVVAGAVDKLLVGDQLIHSLIRENNFEELDKMMRDVERMNGVVVVVSSEHEGGLKLNGLGGVAAILRFKI